MLVGSNMPIFGGGRYPAVSLRLRLEFKTICFHLWSEMNFDLEKKNTISSCNFNCVRFSDSLALFWGVIHGVLENNWATNSGVCTVNIDGKNCFLAGQYLI